jgi:Multidrug resistance efflux pump
MATAAAENTSAPEQKQPNPPKSGKRKFLLAGLAIIVVLCGLAIWGWYEFYGQWSEETDDAYVSGNVVEITPLVTGTVISIAADDGDLVRKDRFCCVSIQAMPKSGCRAPKPIWARSCVRFAACTATSMA